MRYDTVIFDLDGTLLDTLDDLADAINTALTACGYPERTRDEVRRFVGNGVVKLVERAVPAKTTAEDREKVLHIFKEYYSEHSRDLTRPYPGIPELIALLREQNIQMAIVSNKFQAAVEELSVYYFGSSIDVAAGENEAAGIRKKPAPDMVFSAMRELQAEPRRTVYIGDSETDAETAAAAGTDCLLVSWGFRERALLESFHPVFLADHPKEIIEFILKE